jgi:hypothetical protein
MGKRKGGKGRERNSTPGLSTDNQIVGKEIEKCEKERKGWECKIKEKCKRKEKKGKVYGRGSSTRPRKRECS